MAAQPDHLQKQLGRRLSNPPARSPLSNLENLQMSLFSEQTGPIVTTESYPTSRPVRSLALEVTLKIAAVVVLSSLTLSACVPLGPPLPPPAAPVLAPVPLGPGPGPGRF